MKKLVVVADDYGFCESVNEGIVEAHKEGVVTEMSLMLGSPGTEHALRLAKEQGIENIGIHLLLKSWRDTGFIAHRSDYIKLFEESEKEEVARLVENELEEFEKKVGRKPTHINSHIGVAYYEKAISTVVDYAVKNNIPMRRPEVMLYGKEPEWNEDSYVLMKERGIRMTDNFIAYVMGDNYDKLIKLYEKDLLAIEDGEKIELSLHPGIVSDELRSMTSLIEEQARDLRIAKDQEFKNRIEQMSFELVRYDSI